MSEVNPQAFLRSALQQLQAEPGRYKLFGVYWWPIKAMLRQQFGKDQLYMLGTYQDGETAGLVPAMGLDDMISAAAEEYAQNATFPHPSGEVETPDGELVTIFDEDAGL
jgi:hypothetical protein